jgi:hypothetical protein
MHALALVLAYVEGANDERSALFATNEIVGRYIAIVEVERWEPSFKSEWDGPEKRGGG